MKADPDVGRFIAGALFGALTNVDLGPHRIRHLIREAVAIRDLLPPAGRDESPASTQVSADDAAIDDGIHSLRTLLLARLKGLAAYYYHAASLGCTRTRAWSNSSSGPWPPASAGSRPTNSSGSPWSAGRWGSRPSPCPTGRTPRPSATPRSRLCGPRPVSGRGSS